jgi:hypothetical protein
MYLSNVQARGEIRVVVENILRHHPNPFHVTSKEKFYSVIDELLERTGEISIARHFFGLARIASLIFDTHTQIHVTNETPGFESSFPLRFRLFPDGLHITAGSEDYRRAIGKKVVAICGQQPDDVVDRVAQHASSDHLLRKRVFAEIFLYMPETYDAFNLKTPEGKIELVLQDLEGQRSTLDLSKTWQKGYADFSWNRLNPFIPKELLTVHDVFGTAVPFYQKNIDDNYWYQFLDDESKCLYIQINKQFDKEDKHSIEFHLEWTRALWDANAEVVIIDLRNDPGGMTNVGSGLPSFLENMYYTRSNLKGVAVLMGLDTVSAGTILIAELEDRVRPILIGEPTGSSANMHLNAYKMALPHSKLQLEVSQDVYISVHEADPRAYIAPDIPMALSFENYANGRDPLIEAAKTVDEAQMEKMYNGANHNAPWMRTSQEKAIR